MPGSDGKARAPDPVRYADVLAAADRIAGVALNTPVLGCPALDEQVGAPVRLKAESLQRAGAFKFRGACNAVRLLGADVTGVVTFSSGNHAAALALAARLAGRRAVLVMPDDTPQAKVEAVRRAEGEIVFYDRFSDDRDAIVASLQAERGLAFVPPFDDPAIIAGQGTVALELLADAPRVDTLLVPVSGGGLITGCAIAARGMGRRVRIVGVEPHDADDFRRSLIAGERVALPQSQSIADALRISTPGRLTFALAREMVDEIVTVSDDDIRHAMRLLFECSKLVVEPSGTVGVAALLAGRVTAGEGEVGVILSGGNVSVAQFARLVDQT